MESEIIPSSMTKNCDVTYVVLLSRWWGLKEVRSGGVWRGLEGGKMGEWLSNNAKPNSGKGRI